ncbi:MAG: helix-turn-helix domain-containing protein [Oscillospiraceae bacterium]|nr:helix-turn-helix domain-containing protein [Oscillospiraceae bacterium]
MERFEKKRNRRNVLGGAPVFWQLFILLLVILLLALAMLFASGERYTALLTQSYLTQAESAFRQNCETFSSSLFGVYSVPSAVQNTSDYDTLRRAVSGQLPSSTKPVILSALRTSFRSSLAMTRTGKQFESFLYFPSMDAVCTKARAYERAEECFSEYIRYPDMTGEEMTALLKDVSLIRFLPEQKVTVGAAEDDCITLLLHPSSVDPMIGVLLSRDTVLAYFHLESLPEETYFCLSDLDGTQLLSYGDPEAADLYRFNCQFTGVRGQATLGVPKSYFSSLVAPTRRIGAAMIGVMLLVGLALCFWLSSLGSRPLRRLLLSYSLPDETATQRNEIRRLADLLASSRMESDEVHRILSSGILVRVFSGGVLSPEEEEKLRSAYPMLSEPCRVALIHSTATSEEFGQNAITELLREHLPEPFSCATVNALETGVLLPDDEESLHTLANVLSGVNSQLGVDGLSVICGVSAPFTGAHSVYAAVRQAQYSIPILESSYIEVFSAEDSGGDRPGVYSWLTHERLYRAVIKNDREDTLEFVRSLGEDRYAPGAAKEVFYNVRFVIRSTANELELPLPEADALEYHEEMRPKENFSRMETLVSTLFDRLAARQETDADKTSESILDYVAANFRDPDLGAPVIATHFALPVKTVYAIVREKTGMNLGEYLVSVRMKEAAKLLCTTSESVDSIGVACGYPAQSTFYRVFKKYYGESPNRYRSLN